MVTVATASVMMSLAALAIADEKVSTSAPQASVIPVKAGSSLLPDRWCVEAHMITPSLATPFNAREPSYVAWQGTGLSVYDFQFADSSAQRSVLSYRLTGLDSDRLVTFWKSNSMGVYLGVSAGGFLSLSIGQ
jgi:hypothetical protein